MRVVRPSGMTLTESFEWWMPGLIPPIDVCWEWAGGRLPKGYGRLPFGGEGRYIYAHVAAYRIYIGEVPEGLLVRHRCHNPPCCHPAHMHAGTYADNSADMVAADRQKRGEQLPHKLIEADVIAIRASEGVSHRELAAQYGVSQSNVQAIRSRKIWAHVR